VVFDILMRHWITNVYDKTNILVFSDVIFQTNSIFVKK